MTTSKFQLAVGSPIVTLSSYADAPQWQRDAGIAELARIAQVADAAGFHHMTCSEHIGVPGAETGRRGARYWDPLATFGYLSAVTTRIRFLTNVLVLGYHHPLDICKRYGTLDVVSGGRLLLGLGVGTLKEEFDLLGAPFDDRGARADDALRTLRASLSIREPSYHGEFYDYEGLVVDPCAVQKQVPLWIGGRSKRSLRRAVELGDGWCPFAVSPSQAAEWLHAFERPEGFQVVLPPAGRLDPLNQPDRTRDHIARAVESGATIVSCGLATTSLEEYVESLQALAELTGLKTGSAP